MFAHVTTRIPDRPNDGMLGDVGGQGFPTMAFMSADGKVLAKHEAARTIAALDTTGGTAQEYVDVSAKAADGDRDAQIKLLSLDIGLGGVELADAKKRIAALGKISDAMRKEFASKLAGLEFTEAMNTAMQGDRASALENIGKVVKKMVAEDRVPVGQNKMQFWSIALSYADEKEDPDLFGKGAAALKVELKDNPRAGAYLERLDKRLAELEAAKKAKVGGDGKGVDK